MLDSPLEHLYAHALAFAAGALSVVLVKVLMQKASEDALRRAEFGVSRPA
jgi:hypothetical protein